ncbi:MAG: hypothetical protein NTV79_04730, partial [Candidatus Aureabacteria bacterium]|nr:hypothetical protein [Candidatus Auribacterota bacterium]
MKKGLLIFLILVLAGMGVWYFAFRPPASVPLPALIPARTVFFLTANDLAAFWDNFSAGRFWQEVRASPLYRKGGVEERIAVFTALFEASAGFPLDRANFRELFGREAALALLPGEGDRPASLLLVTRVGMKTRALELVSRWRD